MPGPWDRDAYRPFEAFFYQAIALTTAAIGLTSIAAYTSAAASSGPVKMAILTVEGAAMRYRPDAVAPTTAATGGVLKSPGDVIVVYGAVDVENFRMAALSTATIHVEYYR